MWSNESTSIPDWTRAPDGSETAPDRQQWSLSSPASLWYGRRPSPSRAANLCDRMSLGFAFAKRGAVRYRCGRMIGSTFADFTVLDKINHGGMATIFLVADRQGQRLILRMLLPEHRFHWSRLRQFKWGCKVMEQLDHPNIVRYFGSGKFNGLRYAIIEYVEGPNLKEAILRNDPNLRSESAQDADRHGLRPGPRPRPRFSPPRFQAGKRPGSPSRTIRS